jgi:hypothetical protein
MEILVPAMSICYGNALWVRQGIIGISIYDYDEFLLGSQFQPGGNYF